MMQLPLFAPKATWQPPRLSDLPSDWSAFRRVGIDTETHDQHLTTLGPGVRRGASIIGYSVAFEDGPKFYVPMRHPDTANVDERQALAYLRDCGRGFTGEICGANLGYDLDFLWEQEVQFSSCSGYRDVQVAEPLIDELQLSYSLEAIARKYLGRGKTEGGLREAAAAYGVDPKKGMWQLPARFVGPYAEDDADLPLTLLRKQERVIDEQELWQVYDLESALLPVLVRMRRRGVRVDEDRLDEVERYCIARADEEVAKINRITGMTLTRHHLMNSNALAPALQHQGIRLPLTGKTRKPSVSQAVFAEHKDDPVVQALAEARRYNKVSNDFVGSIRKHLIKGRIHTTFNQLRRNKEEDGFDEDGDAAEQEGGRFGRMSCVDPNLQQQIGRDPELTPLWRRIYVPEEGRLWCSADYSQQEPRMAIDAAVRAGGAIDETTGRPFISAFAWERAKAAAQKYRDDPETDNHQMVADMAGIPRKAAKELFLGRIYGMGGPKLCGKLGLPTKIIPHWKDPDRKVEVAGDEGQALMDRLHRELPFIEETSRALQQLARRRGYITTLLGRRCRFPQDGLGNFDWTQKAFNRRVQGSSADQTKVAVVELDRAGFHLQLQIHDETNGSVADHAEARRWGELMRDCMELMVPSKVDVEVGPSWGEAK